MSKFSQDKKRQKAHAAITPETCQYQPKTPIPAQPRFASWRPEDDEGSQRRFWEAPRYGDIVHCRFPDFLRDQFTHTQRKVRPAMVVGTAISPSGEIYVQVAYGTSQVQEDRENGVRPVAGHGLHPGELLVEATDSNNGLERDTKFSLRKVVKLPFDNDWFPPCPLLSYGIHPKRGRYDLKNPVHMRAMEQVIKEACHLGSLLDSDDCKARLKSGQ